MANQITAVIIAGNEQHKINACLQSVSWCQNIILVLANSTDKTELEAKSTGLKIKILKVYDSYGKKFAKWRNIGLNATKTKWILYIDADEIVTPALRQEIISLVQLPPNQTHFAIPRANHFLGQRVKYGGTYPDYVIRLYRKDSLDKWTGQLHEKAIVAGNLGYLTNDLLHFTHNDLTTMLQKTIIWTQTEAEALYQSHHPPVYWWRFLRMILTTIWLRLVKQQMYRDGVVGWISAIFESYNTFIIYARLWQMQQNQIK